MDILSALFRWLHVFAGIVWIGMLYFFNWVNGPFAGTMDADTKKKVVPELMPRALYWFRWGAAWTWVTGVLLLGLVFYMGERAVFEGGAPLTAPAGMMIGLVFLAPFIYDALQKSALGKNPKAFGAAAFAAVAAVVILMARWAGFSYRGFNIHLGVMFGTIMAFNVWFRIWPAQQKIITATKNGEAPDAALVALAGLRSRHNTYLSVPLVFMMVSQHATWAANPIALALIVPAGWAIVYHIYSLAPKVKGF